MAKDKAPKLADFGTLSIAEKKILDEIHLGDFIKLGSGERPVGRTHDNHVRAAFIRYLALGGGDDTFVHERGTLIEGAWIEGELDLRGCIVRQDLFLDDSHFEFAPALFGCNFQTLSFQSSNLPGIRADRAKVAGSLFLRKSIVAGECRFLGAEIGSSLEASGATFENNGGDTLLCDSFKIGGGVFLRESVINGVCRLPGAEIGGVLDSDGAKITNEGTKALVCNSMNVKGTMFLRSVRIVGSIDLTGAQIGHINDRLSCWPDEVILDRCRYGAFTGQDITAKARLDWLGRQDPEKYDQEFWPQPYEQLARVFREMGHTEDAKKVMVAKEKLQREHRRQTSSTAARLWFLFWDTLLAWTIAYGVRPMQALLWLLFFWILGIGAFYGAQIYDEIKPNNAFVLRSAEWVGCAYPKDTDVPEIAGTAWQGKARAQPDQSQLDCFLEQPEARGYPRFNAFVYSADTLLPVVSMEMQEYWLPDGGKGFVGQAARIYLWIHIAVGWALSLLTVAGFTGLVRSSN